MPARRTSSNSRRTAKAAPAVPVARAEAAKRPAVSPYPDLKMAISMLTHRLPHVGEERKKLIEKWVVQLTRLNNEMTRLRKLEELANSLTTAPNGQPKQESLPL